MRNSKRKIINEQGRLFGVVSVIDIFVIVVVAVLALTVLTKSGSSGSPVSTVSTVPVSYTIYVHGARDTAAELLRVGDNLYTDSGTFIGVISDVKVTDAVRPSYKNDGEYVLASVEEKYDVTLTVTAQCSVSGGRYYADRTYELNANTDQKLVTKYNAFNGVIMEITVPQNG